jgi:protein gp37
VSPSIDTGISWTTSTWNPVTGCRRVSDGCARCYALELAARLRRMGNPRYQTDGVTPDGRPDELSGPGFGLALHPDLLEVPLGWRKPRFIFVNSMSDLFQTGIDAGYIEAVFDVMARAHWHTFQVLTKRPGRMAAIVKKVQPEPLPNVWLGTSIEDDRWADVRLPQLRETPAALRFLSIEPLLGDVGTLDLDGVGWVIVGGESGQHLRREWDDRALVEPDGDGGWTPTLAATHWVRSIRRQCSLAGVPLWFKQWGGPTPNSGGHLLDGAEVYERPDPADVARELAGGRLF